MGLGIVYAAKTPAGETCLKFKTLARDADGKRDVRSLWGRGNGALVYERTGSPLVIVAGEEKAMAASLAGFGVLSPITGEGALAVDWITWIIDHGADYNRVILANDNDKAGRDANAKTAEALSRAGWPRTRIHQVVWHEYYEPGWDLNDALKDGVDLFRLLEDAPSAFPRRTLLTVKQLFALDLPEDDNLLGDRILAQGERLSLLGIGGIGKSRLLLQLAICSIMGWDWIGIKTYAKGKKWMLLGPENSARRLTHDLASMLRGHKVETIDYISDRLIIQPNLMDIDLETCLDDPETVKSLAEEAAFHKPDIISFDPLNEYFVGDDSNKAIPMRETLTQMRRIARASGPKIATIISHHARGGKTGAAGAMGFEKSEFGFGSKALYHACRAQINIALGGEEDNPPLVVACGKANNGRSFEARAIRLDPSRMWYEVEEDFDWAGWEALTAGKKAKTAGRPRQMFDDSSVLVRLQDGEKLLKDVVFDITGTLGISDFTARKYIKEMEKDGKILVRIEKNGMIEKKYISLPNVRVSQMSFTDEKTIFSP